MQILDRVKKQGDLTFEEAKILHLELQAVSNMVMMIFKFFLQSKEYTFFVRRLKNVAVTRTNMINDNEPRLEGGSRLFKQSSSNSGQDTSTRATHEASNDYQKSSLIKKA